MIPAATHGAFRVPVEVRLAAFSYGSASYDNRPRFCFEQSKEIVGITEVEVLKVIEAELYEIRDSACVTQSAASRLD